MELKLVLLRTEALSQVGPLEAGAACRKVHRETAGICRKGRRWHGGGAAGLDAGLVDPSENRGGFYRAVPDWGGQASGPPHAAVQRPPGRGMVWGQAREIPRSPTAANSRPTAHPTVGELNPSVQKGHLDSGAQHPIQHSNKL